MADLSSDLLFGVAALLVMSAFIKIFTCINVVRYGLGLSGAGFSLLSAALALALSSVVMVPYLGDAGTLSLIGSKPMERDALKDKLHPFLERNASPELVARFARALAKNTSTSQSSTATPTEADKLKSDTAIKPSLGVLVAAFVVGEVTAALQIAVMVLVPFLVVDLLVVHALMLLGVTSLSAAVVSLPLKLLLFLAVDGWTLISEKLIAGYV